MSRHFFLVVLASAALLVPSLALAEEDGDMPSSSSVATAPGDGTTPSPTIAEEDGDMPSSTGAVVVSPPRPARVLPGIEVLAQRNGQVVRSVSFLERFAGLWLRLSGISRR